MPIALAPQNLCERSEFLYLKSASEVTMVVIHVAEDVPIM
jgi:hypothetical protein